MQNVDIKLPQDDDSQANWTQEDDWSAYIEVHDASSEHTETSSWTSSETTEELSSTYSSHISSTSESSTSSEVSYKDFSMVQVTISSLSSRIEALMTHIGEGVAELRTEKGIKESINNLYSDLAQIEGVKSSAKKAAKAKFKKRTLKSLYVIRHAYDMGLSTEIMKASIILESIQTRLNHAVTFSPYLQTSALVSIQESLHALIQDVNDMETFLKELREDGTQWLHRNPKKLNTSRNKLMKESKSYYKEYVALREKSQEIIVTIRSQGWIPPRSLSSLKIVPMHDIISSYSTTSTHDPRLFSSRDTNLLLSEEIQQPSFLNSSEISQNDWQSPK